MDCPVIKRRQGISSEGKQLAATLLKQEMAELEGSEQANPTPNKTSLPVSSLSVVSVSFLL
jgi:hypothetical protein